MKTSQTMHAETTQFGALQIGIALLGLITAIVHLVILNLQGIDPIFTLNGLGYLALLLAYFLPATFLRERHNLIRWIFIAFTAITILAWIAIGARTTVGYLTKLDELALIVLLWLDGRSSAG